MKNCLFFLLLLFILGSCGGYKEITYFKDIEDQPQGQFYNENNSLNTVVIKTDDELSILVSSKNPQAAAPFNLPLVTQQSYIGTLDQASSLRQQVPAGQAIQTYLVDSKGEINFPVLGKISLMGKSTEQASQYIEQLLIENGYLSDPIVNIQFSNFRISVIGEVNLPGTYYYTNQRVSILDAIASAKDLTIHGRRDNVMVIRDNNGKKEYFRFDLSDSKTFSSPNYYLQQNDVVIIEPNKEKQRDSSSGLQKQFNLSIITSAISTVISVIAILVR